MTVIPLVARLKWLRMRVWIANANRKINLKKFEYIIRYLDGSVSQF